MIYRTDAKVIELELALDKEKDKLKILESSSNETAAQQKQRRALQQRRATRHGASATPAKVCNHGA